VAPDQKTNNAANIMIKHKLPGNLHETFFCTSLSSFVKLQISGLLVWHFDTVYHLPGFHGTTICVSQSPRPLLATSCGTS
jgi:hypothetical protein